MFEKTRSLLLPFFIWSSIAALANVLLIYLQGSTLEQIQKEVFSVFLGARSVWFLLILFFAQLILILCVDKERIVKSLILTMVVYIAVCMFAPNDFLSLFKLKWLFPFFILDFLSYLYRGKIGLIPFLKNKRVLICIVILIGVALPVMIWFVYRSNRFLMYFDFNLSTAADVIHILSYYVLSIMGIVSILALSRGLCSLPFHHVLCLIGRTSIDIYVIHMFLIKIILCVFSTQSNSYLWRYIYAPLIAALIVVSVTIISQKILRKVAIYRKAVGIYRS